MRKRLSMTDTNENRQLSLPAMRDCQSVPVGATLGRPRILSKQNPSPQGEKYDYFPSENPKNSVFRRASEARPYTSFGDLPEQAQKVAVGEGNLGIGIVQDGVQVLGTVFDLLGPELGVVPELTGEPGHQGTAGEDHLHPAA